MTVTLSGFTIRDRSTPPSDRLSVSRNFGIPWPDLGDLFVVAAYSKKSIPSIGRVFGTWVLGYSQDSAQEDIGGEGHIRVWWRVNSKPAPEDVTFEVVLDPPGFARLTIYDVPPLVTDQASSTAAPGTLRPADGLWTIPAGLS